jgi:FkbM family methyltransferase
VRKGWTLRCPRNAAERAYHLQIFDPAQAREFDQFIEFVRTQGRVVLLDIGCHFGIFSFAAIRYGAPGSSALAADPSGEAERMVRRVSRMNRCEDRVQFVRAAAGASEGTIEMVETGCLGAGYVVQPRGHPPSDRRRIRLTTVDALSRELKEPPTVFKIDVEGAEFDVLEGGRHVLGELHTPLFLEIHARMLRERGVNPSIVTRRLVDYGYRILVDGQDWGRGADINEDLVRVMAVP